MSDSGSDFPYASFGPPEDEADTEWQDAPDPDPDDDELDATPDDVLDMLGFDPLGFEAPLEKAYNPDEPRDERGRWSGGGDSADAGVETGKAWGHFKDREEAENFARAVASSKGYDPAKIEVSNEDRKFTLNGQQWSYAGAAYTKDGGDRPKGSIVIYPNHIGEGQMGQVVAHEVMHQKFQSALDRYEAEKSAVDKIARDQMASGVRLKDMIVGADDKLRPEYQSKYPVYAKLQSYFDRFQELRQSDGVSDYSREWWKAQESGKADGMQAIHETLAEMATNEHMVGGEKRFLNPELDGKSATGGAKIWRNLYGDVNKLWRSRNK